MFNYSPEDIALWRGMISKRVVDLCKWNNLSKTQAYVLACYEYYPPEIATAKIQRLAAYQYKG